MEMEIHNREKKRALNIIWNASGDYNFQSEFEGYDAAGKADLYWNYIIGAVHKYYDFAKLQDLFDLLKQDRDHQFYESLAWIGLENCAYERDKRDRPVLESLRRSYSESVLRKQQPESLYYLIEEIKAAHFQRALGIEPQMREPVADILNGLEFDASLTTEEIVLRLKQIIAQNFPLRVARQKKSLFDSVSPVRIYLRLHAKDSLRRFHSPFTGVSLLSILKITPGPSEAGREISERALSHSRMNAAWQNFKEQRENKLRSHIRERFGVSILPESQTRTLEQVLCAGNHKDCCLHFTRGEFDAGDDSDYRRAILKQKDKNQKYFRQNLARHNTSIVKLANIIKNTLLVHFEPSSCKADNGQMLAGLVWRNIHLEDRKIFLKNIRDDIGSLSVDILLDASGSQEDRQEMIASEGYIIGESLKRCQIPVKIASFCTNGNYTILNLFCDYDEEEKNDRIFNYHASGCNRDGLAIRAALHMVGKTRYDHKILIILSDGKPIDPHGIAAAGSDPDLNFYSDTVGVNDAAVEVWKGRQNGITILCVFTGQDEDLPAAQKIYGNDLVCIKSPEKFADIVGVFIKNALTNL